MIISSHETNDRKLVGAGPRPVLEAIDIRKTFGAVEALRGASFTVYPREIVALVGDNGAGKSTLVKILSGALAPDSGEIRFDGVSQRLSSPFVARSLGVETVYQDLALAPELDAADNLYLGRPLMRRGFLGRLGFLDRRQMRARSAETFTELAVTVPDVRSRVARLSGGQKQGVAVARAVSWASKVVIMDEPTAALGVRQTERVLDLIRRVRETGRSVVLISHNMPQVLAVADRVEVLRLGTRVAVHPSKEVTANDLVAAMTGTAR
jgi:simple sugar transport system ATP-binding protein